MSKRRAWFCYELTNYGDYIPVVYFDEPPKNSSLTKRDSDQLPFRLGLVEITEADIGGIEINEDTLPFGKLTEIYQRPRVFYEERREDD